MPTLIGLDSGYKFFRSGEGYAAGAKDPGEFEKIYRLFDIPAIPTTLVYDNTGKVVYKATGVEISEEGLKALEELLYKKIDSLLLL